MRICSFQPGATEIVFALGLEDQLVGVTARCDYPTAASTKPVLVHSVFEGAHHTSGEITRIMSDRSGKGLGLYETDIAALEKAAPDLLLTQAICDV